MGVPVCPLHFPNQTKPNQALLPGARGRAFSRTKKRKRCEGSNDDNLCSQTVVAQLLAAAGQAEHVQAGLVRWFAGLKGGRGLGGGGARLAVHVTREPLFLYGRWVGGWRGSYLWKPTDPGEGRRQMRDACSYRQWR